MKRMMKLLTVVAAAAMGLTACQNNFEEQVGADVKNTVTVSFVSEEARTAVDTSGDTPLFSWNDNETFVVLEQTDALAQATSVVYNNVDGKAIIDAEFAVNADKEEYKYITVYPESGYVAAENINAATLALPAEQSAVEGSYDPNADLMVSWPVITAAQPTEAQPLRFTRLAAVAKLAINNLSLEAGEEVESVEFTANGKALAGTITADLENPHEFTVSNGVSSVAVATAAASEVYFTVLPTTLEAGDAYGVVVATNKHIYIKQGVIPEGKSLVFEAGKVTRIGVNMTEALSGAKWKLVSDASTLKQGDIVTLVAKNYNYVIGKLGSNYPIASQTEAVKVGSYLYHEPASTSVDHMMQTYTLMQRDANRNAFDFYNGVDFEGDASVGFAWATGNNYSPKLQAFCDKNTLFEVSITDGVATLTASEITGSYKYWRYYYSNTVSYNRFDMTTSAPTDVKNQIHLYKLEGAVGTIPVIAANVTVPESDEPVVIAEEGAQSATPIADVVFNYVGDWTIAVSDNAEWLNVVYDAENSCLTYTAEANVSQKRDAVVTITATRNGVTLKPWTFNMLQKGAPKEISIAEFIKLAKDENSTYKLTGVITEMTSSSSGTYKLTDGTNVATITYLYTDAGDKVYDKKDAINLKVGDVMTVTAIPIGSGKGGNSSHYSTYKGHYGLAVEAGAAAEYTGGDVVIEVSTNVNGGITTPTAVEATMTECDYATLTYNGGTSATVSFTTENTTSDALEATVTFTYGLISTSVTVQQGVNPNNKTGYRLVTDASTLAVGDEVIIVAKNADKALACPTKTSDTKFPSTDIEKTGNVIYDIEDAGVQPFKLVAGNSDGKMSFEFTYSDKTYYPYYSSGLKMRTSINDAASWTITINEDGEAFVSTIYSSSTYLIKFNSALASLTFTCYKDSAANATKAENAICIYKKEKK